MHHVMKAARKPAWVEAIFLVRIQMVVETLIFGVSSSAYQRIMALVSWQVRVPNYYRRLKKKI